MKLSKDLNKKPCNPPLGNIRKDLFLRKGNYIIVEGNNDETVLDNILQNNCRVMSGFDKRTIFNEFKTNSYNNQIAIIDKDYDDNIELESVFYTDKNDIESTAISLLNGNYSKLFENMRIDKSNFDDKKQRELFDLTMSITLQISRFNKYIHSYYKKHNILYKYPLKFDGNKGVPYYSLLDRILDKNYNVDYNEMISYYKDRYKNIRFDIASINSTNVDSFRGHDFFIVLSYVLFKNNIKILSLNFDYKYEPYLYLERKFIEKFASNKEITKSKLYGDIKLFSSSYFI